MVKDNHRVDEYVAFKPLTISEYNIGKKKVPAGSAYRHR